MVCIGSGVLSLCFVAFAEKKAPCMRQRSIQGASIGMGRQEREGVSATYSVGDELSSF